MTTAIKVGDKVRWGGSGGWEVVLAVTSAHAFLVDASVGTASVLRVPLSELTLVESAPSEPGKSTDLLYGWERCSHEGIGKPGCSTCDPDKSRCVAKLERDLAQRDATIAELRTRLGALEGYAERAAERHVARDAELQAARAKSEQRREALSKYECTTPECIDEQCLAIARALSDDAPPKAEDLSKVVADAMERSKPLVAAAAKRGRSLTAAPGIVGAATKAEAAPSEPGEVMSYGLPLWKQFANERDALKAEVERLKSDLLKAGWAECHEIERLKAEVERLKTEAQAKMSGKFYVMSDAEVVTIEGLQADVGRLTGERDALKAEVERLKNERADCAENHYSAEEGRALETENDKLRDVHSAFNSNNIQLRAENAKLREALQRCAAQLADWRDASEVKYPGDRKALDMAAALGVKVTP